MSIGLLCPGQGGQSANTLDSLLNDDILSPLAASLVSALPTGFDQAMRDANQCMTNPVAQPLVVMAGVCAAQAIHQAGFEITAVAGYSVGEVTAQAACLGMSAEQALLLALQRGQIMSDNAMPDCGLMAVTQMRLSLLEPLCVGHGCFVAIVNGEDHAVIAGTHSNLDELNSALSGYFGAQAKRLPVSIASHSPLMGASGELLLNYLKDDQWPRAPIGLVSGLNGYSLYSSDERKDSLVKQMTQTVQWHRTMQSMVESGCKVFLELGPGNALSKMMSSQFPGVVARSLADFSSFVGAVQWLKAQANRA